MEVKWFNTAINLCHKGRKVSKYPLKGFKKVKYLKL